MKQKFSFLCGNAGNIKYIFGVKFGVHPWHYFEEIDSILSEHGSLPSELDDLVGSLKKNRSIDVELNDDQAQNYFKNGKFVFKNIELKTRISLTTRDELPKRKSRRNDTSRLVFISGQTNPLLFLKEFEKCDDVATNKDKMFKIRNFVDDNHLVEFCELYFTCDWHAVKLAFLKKYSMLFLENKKKNLNIQFHAENSLRAFVEKKLSALASYTTLPFINRMEMILNDLPTAISRHFLLHEKLTCDEAEILDFCDCIQHVIEDSCETENRNVAAAENSEQETENCKNVDVIENVQMNRMEIFNFSTESDANESTMMCDDSETGDDLGVPGPSKRGRGSGRSVMRGVRRGVRRGKVVKSERVARIPTIPEDDSSSCSYTSRLRRSTRTSSVSSSDFDL